MALRLREQSRSRKVRIDDGLRLPAETVLPSLVRVRQQVSLAGLNNLADECLIVERMIRSGRKPVIRPWLRRELKAVLAPTQSPVAPGNATAAKATLDSSRRQPSQAENIVATRWAESCPHAPDSILLPELPAGVVDALESLSLSLDGNAQRWTRWACMHSSYIYEALPDSPVSAETLEVLAALGKGWMRVALIDRVRARLGDFESNNEVSTVLMASKQVWSAMGNWVRSNDIGHFGKGETTLIASGSRSTAPDNVALQIVGALSMVTASQDPADGLLEYLQFELEQPEPDWVSLLTNSVNGQIEYVRSEVGPDHDKKFLIKVKAGGKSTAGTGPSVKAARREAAKDYVFKFLPGVVPRTTKLPRPTPKPLAFEGRDPEHVRARKWAQQAFEVADAGLMDQALTHRSWVYEHRSLATHARQRDYGVLATEGSEALANVVRHQYALNTLNRDVRVPKSAVTSPPLPRESIVKLFDKMPVERGVLRSKGMNISADVKEDVTQAIVGAAWRANGDLLMERQPATLTQWVASFTPPRDPATLLQEYCARHVRSTYSVDFERKGPDHETEFRATLTVNVHGQPKWHGTWRNAHTSAKQAAAASVLDFLLGVSMPNDVNSNEDKRALLRAMFLAEIRVTDSERLIPEREIASGRLAVDSLATRDYVAFSNWASLRSPLLPSGGSAVATKLTDYYQAVLTQHRRDTIRKWILDQLPTRGAEHADAREEVASWVKGDSVVKLSLFENLLSSVTTAGFADGVFDYLEWQAMVVGETTGIELETVRSSDADAHSLTLRLPGAELPSALDPVLEVVEATIGSVSLTRDKQSLFASVAVTPSTKDTLTGAGFIAVERSSKDPWLSLVNEVLRLFLAEAEKCMLSDSGICEDQPVDGLLAQERALISQTRA